MLVRIKTLRVIRSPALPLYVMALLPPSPPPRKDSNNPRGPYREGGTKYISVSQAKGMIEAVAVR